MENPYLEHLTPEEKGRFNALVLEFEQAWEAFLQGCGAAPEVADYLPPERTLREAVTAELLVIDLERRLSSGLEVSAERHLRELPELQGAPPAARYLIARACELRAEESSSDSPGQSSALWWFSSRTSSRNCNGKASRDGVGSPAAANLASVVGAPAVPGYEILGELGRGGAGVVYRGRDLALGRDVAIKVLRTRYRDQPQWVDRFVEEAQVGGQLSHPGIVPVYEVGRLGDGRPYFTMKLVQGRTLADLLEGRRSPEDDLARFLGVFEQVCQTVAYGHSKGVLHRDLKPSNIMVGAFGEVQVMDWGLAKVFESAGVEEPTGPETSAWESEIQTVRTQAGGLSSQVGAVLGTYAYMPPEQAQGLVGELDERSDVFGLGAILCVILTGEAPYRGTAEEVPHRAALGDLAEALGRLEASGADGELVGLATACLASRKEMRPRDAGAVAQAVAAYQAGAQQRLRHAELTRVAAEARADEALAREAAERRARRRSVLLVLAGALLLAVVGAGGWEALRIRREFDAREPEVRRLQETGRYQEAKAVVQRMEGLAQTFLVGAGLSARVCLLQADLKMLDDLENARLAKAELAPDRRKYGLHSAAPKYRKAFQDYGLAVLTLGPAEAAATIQARPIRGALLEALADWALVTPDKKEQESLLNVGRTAGPGSGTFGESWRDAVKRSDRKGLARLARQPEANRLPPAYVVMLSLDLTRLGRGREALQLLREAQQRQPGDFLLNVVLAFALERAGPPQRAEEVRFWTAALALRPQSPATHSNLGTALLEHKDLPGAERAFREAIHLDPRLSAAHNNLGAALHAQWELEEAEKEFREAVRLDPEFATAHYNLSGVLLLRRKWTEAIKAHGVAIRLDPKLAVSNYFGTLSLTNGRLPEAVGRLQGVIKALRDKDKLSSPKGP